MPEQNSFAESQKLAGQIQAPEQTVPTGPRKTVKVPGLAPGLDSAQTEVLSSYEALRKPAVKMPEQTEPAEKQTVEKGPERREPVTDLKPAAG